MKKIKLLLVAFVLSLSLCNSNIKANENTTDSEERYFETYIIDNTKQRSSIRSGTKVLNYKDVDGNILWSAQLSGSFRIDGTNVTCIKSSISVNSFSKNWIVLSKSTTKNKNSALGSVRFVKRFGIIPITYVSKTIKLTCDSKGNLS